MTSVPLRNELYLGCVCYNDIKDEALDVSGGSPCTRAEYPTGGERQKYTRDLELNIGWLVSWERR